MNFWTSGTANDRQSSLCKATTTPQTVNKPSLFRKTAVTLLVVNLIGTIAKKIVIQLIPVTLNM